MSVGKPIELPAGAGARPQSWRILARAGEVDLTINLSLVETMDDRSVTVQGSTATAHLNIATDTLIKSRENAAEIVLNPALMSLDFAMQHLREGLVNFARQASSLNRKSLYATSFQGMVGEFVQAIRSDQPIDPRFNASTATKVMSAVEASASLLPQELLNHLKLALPHGQPKPTVLVTGGTGFLGANLTRALVAKGYHVRVLSRGSSSLFNDIWDRVQIAPADLKNLSELADAMNNIDTVFHLARALGSIWDECLSEDVEMTEAVAQAALDAGAQRFVFTGTIASFDMSNAATTIDEHTQFADDLSDRNLYARSKAECEKRLRRMHRNKGLPLVVTRPGIVIGDGGPLQHWGIGRWHGAGCVKIWGRGTHKLPFVGIKDVSDAMIKMMEHPDAVCQTFNLVGDPIFSARDYFDAIHHVTGARINVRRGSLFAYFIADTLKYHLKTRVLKRTGQAQASLKDWQSRAHFSRFDNRFSRDFLDWEPLGDRQKFIAENIRSKSLFGF